MTDADASVGDTAPREYSTMHSMRSFASARSLACGLAFAFAAAAPSCTTFPSITAGACGNGIIERDHDEDCDGFAAGDATSCRAPGAAGQCHFDCSADQHHVCPSGYGCGRDAICRAGSSTFAPVASVELSDVSRLTTGDFDGDGRVDIVTESALDVHVLYFDDAFALGSKLRLPLQRARASVGHFSDPSHADLVVSNSGGVDVLHGRSDRTLAPTVYPSFPIPGTSVRLIAIEALPQNPGIELFVMGIGQGAGGSIVRVSTKNGQPTPVFALPAPPDKLATDIAIGNFFESTALSPCDEFAMAFQGESRVHVYTPCRSNGATIEINALQLAAGDPAQMILPDVMLPGATPVTGLRTGRINADTHLDLLVDTAAGIFVAYGVGDGTFHSSPTVPASLGDNKASAFTLTVTGDGTAKISDFPLAVGDLDGDDIADLVLPKGIVFHKGDGTYATSVLAPQPWTLARVADVNGNGLRDVIAASDVSIDFYNGTGTRLLNHATYTAAGPVGFMSIGDVDGDLVNDVVFRASITTASATSAAEDDLSVMFGAALAYPDAPLVVGRLPLIIEIAVAPFERSLVNENQPADDIADIAVVSKIKDALVIAALAGRADRQLASPFFLVNGKDPTLRDRALVPSLFATGSFVDPGHESISVLAYDPSLPDPTRPAGTRLWIAPLASDASVDTSNIRPGTETLPSGLDYERSTQMVAVDLDDPSAGGTDELVLLAPPLVGGQGMLYVARLVNGQWVGEKIPFGDASAARDWRLAAADVDGDGAKDVVVLFSDATGARKIVVLWNTRSGHLDPNGTSVPVPAADAAPLAFTCVNVDRDPALEIVMVTAKAAYVAKLDPGGPGGRAFSTPATLLANVSGGIAIASGDVNADGVADLAVAGGGVVSVYAGVSAIK